ncbi:MAG: NAD(P)H-quinone oxidoreductase [Eubacteriales bacterium]|nr:NAD(P)H-quinone oxidoreductase [Eubacteriales bacterium]
MKAMLVNEAQQLVWSDVEEPCVGPADVLVEIYAAALNRADILQRQGKYPSPKGCPPWMGLEVAGIITQVGAEAAANSAWKPGDQVCALLGGGGYAQRVAVPYTMLMPIPKGLSFEEAASLPEAYATCYLNLFGEGAFQPGETLFFPAGASGLASVGIPMAKAFGAYVLTSVQTAEKKAEIAHLHADVVVDTSREDVVEVIRREAEAGHPIDVAIDCLAGETIGRVFPYVNEGCRWVLISTLDGTSTTVPLRAVLTKGIVFKGSMLRKRTVSEKSAILANLVRDIWPKLESREIVPTIYKVLPIAQANEAHGILERGENTGKVVLRVREHE